MATTRQTHAKTGYPSAAKSTSRRSTRPALVIQNDVSNRWSDIAMVAPITSTVRFPLNPVHVLIGADSSTGLVVPSVALFNQIRAVAW